MDIQYGPEGQAVAAMKLGAEADGPERQRWISAALAWSELTRLGGAAEHSVPEGWPTRQLVAGARRSSSSDPLSSRWDRVQGGMRFRTRLRPQILAGEARTAGWARKVRKAPLAGSRGALREGGQARSGAHYATINNDRGVRVRPRRIRRSWMQAAWCAAPAAAVRSLPVLRRRPWSRTAWRDRGDDAG